MTRILEKMSLLGLSLLLISAFSISTALPPMLDYYSPTFSAAQVELLVSVPSFSVVAMLLLNSITENSLDLCLSYLWFWFCDFDYVPPFCAIDGAGGEEADYKKKTSSEQKRPWYDSWHGSFSRFCHLYQFFD